jgi:hypothetical protein
MRKVSSLKKFAAVIGAVREITSFNITYIGPGTGSLIIQAVLAAMLGAAVAARLYWSRIKRFFSRKKGEQEPEPEPEVDE